jgi:hypothetical protein
MIILDEKIHCRTISFKYGTASIHWVRKNIDPSAELYESSKHKYLMPLNKKMRKKILALLGNDGKEYPKKL